MIEFIKKIYIKYGEGIRYLICGVLTTIISWSAKYVATFFLDSSIVWQNSLLSAITWFTGVCAAFVLNRMIVFKSKDANWFSELVKMFSGRAGIGVVGILLQNVFVNVMGMNLWVSTILWAVIEVLSNYFVSKFWVFRKINKD